MTILEEITQYCHLCLKDARCSEYEDYISGQKHKWACKRFLDDVSKAKKEDYPYYWDEAEAERIVKWFALLHHSKGELAGQPIILTAWQKFILCQLYGWRRKDNNRRRFKRSFTEVGRKNAKSQVEAGIALYEISVGATRNSEVYEYYTAGVKREQSKIIFEEAKLMLVGSPLRSKFKLTRDLVRHIATGSFIKPLSKEDGKSGDGTNPAGLILDEYHQHRTTEFYDLGLGSGTKEPLLMIITTAGIDLTYPCYTQEYELCSRILDPGVDLDNDEYLIDILELDPEDYKDVTSLENERLWHKANPIRMSFPEGAEKIRGEWEIAKQLPEKLTAFLTKCMNIWVQAQVNAYMDMSKWSARCVKELPVPLKGLAVYVGFDMSAKNDLTSVAFDVVYKIGVDDFGVDILGHIVISHSFIPTREKLMEHVLKDKAPYDSWEREGFITITNTQIVDQGAVMQYALDFIAKHELDLQCFCFDPANASKMMMDFSEAGYDCEEVYQSYRSLNEATAGFRDDVYAGRVCYQRNPVLNYALSNAVLRTNQGLIKVDKDATTKRIDPVDAELAAYKLARYHQFTNSFESAIDAFLAEEW
jgi:phage terminase large subunit-like protein